MNTRERIGYTVGWLGVVLFSATLTFGVWLEYARPGQAHSFVYLPVFGFAALGWWGFFWARPAQATEGARVLVDTYRKTRPGERADDPPGLRVAPAAVVIEGEGDEEGITPPPATMATRVAQQAPSAATALAAIVAVRAAPPDTPVGALVDGEGD